MDRENSVRADVWLWAARLFKTRSLSRDAIDGGKVEHNDAACKPAKPIKPGDRLRVTRGAESFAIEVLAVSEKRGPASVAQTLYRETDASIAAREATREQRRLIGNVGPEKRPDKQGRRALRRLKDWR
ncbi:MAG TPA: S4 domain-containing protein [Rudaea sp.]|nr:S4 domain-containing protein [Rudaea sp.]